MARQLDREPEQAQVEFYGKIFKRRVNPDDPIHLLQQRRVRIIGSRRLHSGTLCFRAASECSINPSDFPKVPLSEADSMHDIAEADRALSTARKKGASQPGIDIEEVYRQRGGTGERLPIGPAGFFSKKERRRILKLRSQRGNSVQR